MFEAHPQYSHTENKSHRRAAAFWVLQQPIQREHLQRIRAWYRKRISEIRQVGSPVGLDQRRNRRLPARLHRGRNWFETDFPNWLKQEPPKFGPASRGEEHASYLIEALRNGRPYRGHINVVNQNHITNLPNGCVIEVPAYADRTGINVPVIGALPLACAATCSSVGARAGMAKEAGRARRRHVAQASSTARSMTGSGLKSRRNLADGRRTAGRAAPWLPQYRRAIPGARARLARAERNGTRVKLSHTSGACAVEDQEHRANWLATKPPRAATRQRGQGKTIAGVAGSDVNPPILGRSMPKFTQFL